MKNIENPFAGKKVICLKETFTYPNSGKVRFEIQLDKNGQVHDIIQTFAQIIKEGNRKFVKLTYGDRPKRLYERIHGRPFMFASDWIDAYVENLNVQEYNISE